MPRVAAPGNRARIEAALDPDQRMALRSMCLALEVPPDEWHTRPALARPWTATAVAQLAARIREERGCAWKDARDEAALRLGLNPDTVATALRRFRRGSL